jgi:hypothetical protein
MLATWCLGNKLDNAETKALGIGGVVWGEDETRLSSDFVSVDPELSMNITAGMPEF